MAKKKFYAVAVGTNPGIYESWSEAECQVKGVAGARYKSFKTRAEAEDWLQRGEDSSTAYGTQKRQYKSAVQTRTRSGSDEIILYTDGGSINNPGPGGWGVVRLDQNGKAELSGGFRLTTNNRMELVACIKALESVGKTGKKITLYSDSSYVVNGIEKGWAAGWQRNDWKKSDGEPAKNSDLWEQLLELNGKLSVRFVWVKGHAGNTYNERCDTLARLTAESNPAAVDTCYEGC